MSAETEPFATEAEMYQAATMLATRDAEIERLRAALYDVTMIFASRPDIYAMTGFAERPVIERARQLCNAADAESR
jgi:hypothetical protein